MDTPDSDKTIRAFDVRGAGVPSLASGAELGGYRVEKLLGMGTMGEVYLARHIWLERVCALKVLSDDLSHSRDFVRRFMVEGRALARLSHEGIVSILNAGEDGGRHFLEMEYVEGGSLEGLLDGSGGRLEAAKARQLLGEVLAALAYAHGAGIVHRDLKPANILLSSGGRAKIGDFGLALVAGEEFMGTLVRRSIALGMLGDRTLPDTTPLRKTASGADAGALVGTFDFMSPEVLDGAGAADARSDIYAAGVIAYLALTGRKPRGGRAKDPSKLVPGLDPAWDEWVFRCMEPEPQDRFQSATEALAAMPGAAAAQKAMPPPVPAQKPKPPPSPKAPEPQPSPKPAPAPKHKPKPSPAPKPPEPDPPDQVQVALYTTPPGATVHISGGKWNHAFFNVPTPVQFKASPGSYTLRFDGVPGHRAAQRQIEVRVGKPLKLEVALEPEPPPPPKEPETKTGDVKTITLPGGEPLEMVWIAPGTFTMGSPSSESGRFDNETQHRVTLTKGYWLGKYEVTQGQWQAVMGNNPSYFKKGRVIETHIFSADEIDNEDKSRHPVEQVSWNDAQEYCRKLTERERAAGRLPAGYEYSLPTEAQWEFACRAGTTGPYAGNGTLSSMGWYDDNSGGTTHPVGQKRANAWGLYDMHGNVWEWCHDWYGSYPGGAVTDPTGASSGSGRVARGGCWYGGAWFCRSAGRCGGPSSRYNGLGFRIALRSVQ